MVPTAGIRARDWAAIRDHLITNSCALEELRAALEDAFESGTKLTSVTDLRLLDLDESVFSEN